MSRILAIDFGLKRLGISISDPTNTLASPYPTLDNNPKAIDKILDLIKVYDVNLILIGYPLNMDGSKSTFCDEVDKFVLNLQKRTAVNILKRDERLTSYIAQQQILESVKSKKKRRDKSLIDQFSARIILQEYLDEIKHQHN